MLWIFRFQLDLLRVLILAASPQFFLRLVANLIVPLREFRLALLELQGRNWSVAETHSHEILTLLANRMKNLIHLSRYKHYIRALESLLEQSLPIDLVLFDLLQISLPHRLSA